MAAELRLRDFIDDALRRQIEMVGTDQHPHRGSFPTFSLTGDCILWLVRDEEHQRTRPAVQHGRP